MAEQWYWCTRHERIEQAGHCPARYTFGPYATRQEAAEYAARAEARNERWQDDDERWYGDDDW